MLPTLSKVAESVMHARLFRHYISNNIISERQAAYLKGDSTTQQLLYIVNMIKTNWNKGNFTHGCFLDASAAFDRCWVNGMLAKLRQIKVEGKCLDMFESYLTNRKICTVIDGAKSLLLDVNAGVPQGSRLGPLLWILYNQDIIDDLESECLLYADDTCLFAFGKDPVESVEILNKDLSKIATWAEKWKVLFNAKKTKDMVFTKSRVWSNMTPPLVLNESPITRVHQHKHLGLWLTSSLDWGKQIQETCLKATRKLAVLRSCKFLDRSTLDILYKVTIRSVLEYGLIVYYHSLTQCQKKRLSQIQYRAAKLVTGALHFTSQIKLEEDLSWESISDRADFLSLCFFHKISTHETRPLIRSCMPQLHNKTINTRSNNKYIEFTFKNDSFNKSFFPVVTKLYNNLDLSMRNLPNCADFKEQLKAKYKKIKVKHYSRGISKYANTLHTQLRVGQSYLNSHGFKINLREDDLCLCHRSETVSHFFLDCFLYQEERDELLKKISQYLPRFNTFSKTKKLEIILYGFNLSNNEPDPRNLSIAFAVQNFILKTKRFSPSSLPSPPIPST